jgi:hypothetical protein
MNVTPFEPHRGSHIVRLNWLRAGVLGANDGIVSIAALLVGIAAATSDTNAILLAGVAGLAAGSISMGLGEYVSVSSQRDSELSLIAKEKREEEVERLKKEFHVDFGSGYPSDPKTVLFLKENFDNKLFEKIIRHSWSTVKRFKEKERQEKLF